MFMHAVFLASSLLSFSLMKDMSVQIGNQVLVDSADLNQWFKLGICLTCFVDMLVGSNQIAPTESNMAYQPNRPRLAPCRRRRRGCTCRRSSSHDVQFARFRVVHTHHRRHGCGRADVSSLARCPRDISQAATGSNGQGACHRHRRASSPHCLGPRLPSSVGFVHTPEPSYWSHCHALPWRVLDHQWLHEQMNYVAQAFVALDGEIVIEIVDIAKTFEESDASAARRAEFSHDEARWSSSRSARTSWACDRMVAVDDFKFEVVRFVHPAVGLTNSVTPLRGAPTVQ